MPRGRCRLGQAFPETSCSCRGICGLAIDWTMPKTSVIASITLGLASLTVAQPGYVSPLTGSLSTHDPVLIKQDSVYYLFHTGNGVPVKTSRDRLQWDEG